MNMSDEELQKRIESGIEDSHADARAYRAVFRGLNREPDYNLPVYFSDRLIARLESSQQQKASRDFLWLGIGIFLLLVTLIIAIVASFSMTNLSMDLTFLSNLFHYRWFIISAMVMISIFNWIDKRLMKQIESF